MNYVQVELYQERPMGSSYRTHYWVPQFGTNKVEVKLGCMVELDKGDWWEVTFVSPPREGFTVRKQHNECRKLKEKLK